MLISKIYNHNNKSNNTSKQSQQQINQSGTSNSRILTPSSIPIFILPPTLDTINANGAKPELNDSLDCLSIKLADDELSSSNLNETTTNTIVNNKNNNTTSNVSSLRTSKLTKNTSYASASTFANDLKAVTYRSFDLSSKQQTNQSLISLNNLKNNNIGNQTNNSTTSSSNHLRPSFKLKMNHSNSISNPSNSPAQTPSHSKTSVNAFFELNNTSNNALNDDDNELKNKETYCNYWILNNNRSSEYLNEKKSMNGSIKSNDSNCSAYLMRNKNESSNQNDKLTHNSLIVARSQPAAVSTYSIANHSCNKHIDDEYITKAKEEEKLQREYLVNLLKQLESEQEAQQAYSRLSNNITSMDESKQNELINKKTKRSKSETFLEINSIRTPLNGKKINKENDTKNKLRNQNNSRKTNKTTKSNLDPNYNQEENLRRFSFRSLFKSKYLNKSHQNMHNTLLSSNAPNKSSSRHIDSMFNTNISSNAASISQYSSNNSSLDKTSSNKISVFDLTRAATRLSNSNLINPLINLNDTSATGLTNTSLLTFKRQSFKLSRRLNQRKTLDDDLDPDNLNNTIDDQSQLDDVEKAFNEFYLKNKIENPIRSGTSCSNHNDEDLNYLHKALPRRSLLSTFFGLHKQNDFDRSKSLTLDANGRRKFKLFKNKSKVVLSYNDDETNNFGECFYNLHNLNLTLIEHEYKRHSVKDIIYLKLNKSLFSSSSSSKRNQNQSESHALIDVSIERLQQNSKNLHVLSMNLKNLKVEPLFEINHIKSKLTYFKICLVDSDDISNECNNHNGNKNIDEISNLHDKNNKCSATSNNKTKIKNFARIQRLKRIKLKFNANNKNLQKPVDFELSDDHFMTVNNEATIMITQPGQVNSMRKSLTEPLYFFLLSIELHSYLPVSRKILSSTFSKKKKIYRGQCQINENFIRMTQFNKKFELQEV